MRAICTNKDCGITYEGRRVDHSIKCSEILLCSKCGSILLPEGEDLEEAEVVEAL